MMPVALFMIAALETADSPAGHCLRANADLPPGSVARSMDFAPAPCPAAGLGTAFRHDSMAGVSRLSRSVSEGEIVRAFPEFGLPMVRPGETLHILLATGATRIEREVVALQAARPGQRLFVRTVDGGILSVRYEVEP